MAEATAAARGVRLQAVNLPAASAFVNPIRRTTGHGRRRAGHQSFPLMQQVQPRSRGHHRGVEPATCQDRCRGFRVPALRVTIPRARDYGDRQREVKIVRKADRDGRTSTRKPPLPVERLAGLDLGAAPHRAGSRGPRGRAPHRHQSRRGGTARRGGARRRHRAPRASRWHASPGLILAHVDYGAAGPSPYDRGCWLSCAEPFGSGLAGLGWVTCYPQAPIV